MKKHMIAISVVVLAVVSLLALTACQKDGYRIENHDWQFRFVQSSEDGSILFCSEEESKFYPEAEIMEMTAKAESSKLTVTDGENEMLFAYVVEKIVPEKDTIYMIQDLECVTGYASVGKTTYADGSSEYTLIITFEERVYYFKAPAD